MTALDCYRHGCTGTLQSGSDGVLLVCEDCDMQLQEPAVKRLADDSGPLAQLATYLCETYE